MGDTNDIDDIPSSEESSIIDPNINTMEVNKIILKMFNSI